MSLELTKPPFPFILTLDERSSSSSLCTVHVRNFPASNRPKARLSLIQGLGSKGGQRKHLMKMIGSTVD